MGGKKYDAVIIGGGIIGCSLAFELAKRGVRKILIVEKRYLTAGATGRCNAGFRMLWSTPLYVELSRQSVDTFLHINEYTGYPCDCEVVQSGYLFPLYTDQEIQNYLPVIEFQKTQGLGARFIAAEEMAEIAPGINTQGVRCAVWSGSDGTANPFQCTFAYAMGAKALGAEIAVQTEVKAILVKNGRVWGVVTDRGEFETEQIFNCANVAAPEIAALVGDNIPIRRELRQTMISEKVAPMGREGAPLPLIIGISQGNWIKQCPCGTLMMGKAEKHPYTGEQLEWDFMEKTAAVNAALLPKIRTVKLIRQYQGVYDISPDCSPIVHRSAYAEGLITLCGFSGHGFMIAPEFARWVAEDFCGRGTEKRLDVFGIDRFETGRLLIDQLAI